MGRSPRRVTGDGVTDEITEFPTKLNSLPADERAARRVALKARKAFTAVLSPFVRAMRECMTAYLEARQQGVERADAAKGIELALRDLWPKPTTKFGPQCQACDDTGYQEHVCRPYRRCERPRCHAKGEDWQHTYVTPCDCARGLRCTPKSITAESAAASVGKVSKPSRGFSRIGG